MAPLNVPVVLMEQSIDRRRCAMKLHVFTHLRPSFSPARLAVTVVFFINGFVFSNWVPRIPAIQQHLGLNTGMLGLALWGIAIGALLSQSLAGWLVTPQQPDGHARRVASVLYGPSSARSCHGSSYAHACPLRARSDQ